MKYSKFLAIVLAILTILSVASGCGKDKSNDSDASSTEKTASESATNGDKATTEPSPSASPETEKEEEKNDYVTPPAGYDQKYTELPSELNSYKINSINTVNRTIIDVFAKSITYKDVFGKFGIMSCDGKKDTGAKYGQLDDASNGDYYVVSDMPNSSMDPEKVETLNCMGLVDIDGKEIIPQKYAVIKKLNDQFYQACTVTEQTDNKDEMLVYFTSNMFSISVAEGDILFKGVWEVYDVTTGQKVKGATGTKNVQVSAYANYVSYKTDAGESLRVYANGEKADSNRYIFEDGSYRVIDGDDCTMYNVDGKVLFTFNYVDGYHPIESTDGYILASKYTDGKSKYVFLDNTGKVISKEFSERPYVRGELVLSDGNVYDLKGNLVTEEKAETLYCEQEIGNVWFLKNGKELTMIKADGTVLYKGTEEDDVTIGYYSQFYVIKKVDLKSYYYSIKDKDFTLTGNMRAPWLLEVDNADGSKDLVDMLSGKTLVSGHDFYNCVAVDGSFYYVYAKSEDGSRTDVYIIK